MPIDEDADAINSHMLEAMKRLEMQFAGRDVDSRDAHTWAAYNEIKAARDLIVNGETHGVECVVDDDHECIDVPCVYIPVSVFDSEAYMALSHPARGLLLEVAMQCHGDDNGRLLMSRAHLAARGWKSADVIQRAKQELLDGGLIFETVKGGPNKASRYAVTWWDLDERPEYDHGAAAAFMRHAYVAKRAISRLMNRRPGPCDGQD